MVAAGRPRRRPGRLAALALAAAATATMTGCRRPAPTGRSGNPPAHDAGAAPVAPTVAGTVTDSRGVPVAGARVLLWSRDQGIASPPQQTTADAGGRFTFAAGGPRAPGVPGAPPRF